MHTHLLPIRSSTSEDMYLSRPSISVIITKVLLFVIKEVAIVRIVCMNSNSNATCDPQDCVESTKDQVRTRLQTKLA